MGGSLDIFGVSWYCRLNLHQPSTFTRDNKHLPYILLPISFSTSFSTKLTETVEKFRNHRFYILFDLRIIQSHQFFHDDFTELFVVDVSKNWIVHTVSYQDGLGIHQVRVDHPSLMYPYIVDHERVQSYKDQYRDLGSFVIAICWFVVEEN